MAAALGGVLLLGACTSGTGAGSPDRDAATAGTDGAQAARTSAPDASPSPTPTPEPPAQVLSRLARRGLTAGYVGTYVLDPAAPGRQDARARLFRRGDLVRVEVVRGSARSILTTTPRGPVSCQVEGRDRTCLLVAGPGERPPALFDPGLQRLVGADLEAFARRIGRLTVTDAGVLPATGRLPSARCFLVDGGADDGEFCLAPGGILRRAQFDSGRLDLVRLDDRPPRAAFRPPVKPTPLP